MNREVIATGPCFGCRELFWFNPNRVPSVFINCDTGLPPALDPKTCDQCSDQATHYSPSGIAACPGHRTPDMIPRARREPFCQRCVCTLNTHRAALRKPQLTILDGAYPDAPTQISG